MHTKNAPITLDINSSQAKPQLSLIYHSSSSTQVSVFYSWIKSFLIIMLITQTKCFYLTTISEMIEASSNYHVIQDFQDFMKVSRDKPKQQTLVLFMDMFQKMESDQSREKIQRDRKLKNEQIQLDLKLRVNKKSKLQQIIANENELNENTTKQTMETPFSRLNKQTKVTKKYVATIYPYKVYQLHSLQNVTLNYLKQLLTQQQRSQSSTSAVGQQNTTYVRQEKEKEKEKEEKREQKNKQNVTKQNKQILDTPTNISNQTEHGHKDLVILSQAFVFIRIDKCVHKDACKLIQMLPYNFVIMAQNITQHLKFHKISTHNFVIESIKQVQTNQTNRTQIDAQQNNKAEQQQQQSQVLYITSVYDYTLNINNYLFLKLAEEAEQKKKKAIQNMASQNYNISNKQEDVVKKEQRIFIGYQSRILIQHKIFQIYSNQSSVWDMAYNGSSLRCVKFQKIPVSAAIRKHIEQHNIANSNAPNNQQNKISNIPINYKAFTALLTNKSQTLKQSNQQSQNELNTYLNTIKLVQLNINLNQQNHNYITQFYSSQYHPASSTAKTQAANTTRRKNMIGITKSNNFFIFFTHFVNSTCKLTRVFRAGLKKLELFDQIIVNNRVNVGQEVDKMGRRMQDNALVYFLEANSESGNGSQKEFLIGSLYIKEVGKQDQDKKLIVAKGSMRQCTFRVFQQKAKMVGSPNSTDIEQKMKQKLQKVDIYKLGSDFVAVCYYKIRSLQQSKGKYCQILHSNCKPFYNLSLPVEQQGKLEWAYSQDDTQVKSSFIRLFFEPSAPNATIKTYLSLQVDKQNLLNQAYKSNFMRANQFPFIYPNVSQQSDLSEDYSKFIAEDPQSIYYNKKQSQSPAPLNQSFSNIANISVPLISSSSPQSSMATQQNLTAEQNITQADISESQQAVLDKLKNIENATFFNYKDYIDRDRYRYLYGSRLLESKLKVMYSSRWTETAQQQQSNCKIVWKNQGNEKKIIGIGFGSNNSNNQTTKNESHRIWSICRISIDTSHQNLVLQPSKQSIITHNNTLAHPYKIHRCSLHSSPYLLKCSYNEWQANGQSLLPASSKSILFIINNGQTYSLKLSDLNSIQMDKVAQSFFIMFLSLSALTFLFTCVIICRPVLLYFCVWAGWAGGAQIGWRYPLNCFQLRLKLRRMRKMGLIKEISSKKHNQIEQEIEHDDCIFCLQPKQPGLKMIEVYCKHAYHKQCFEAWIKQESGQLSCPMCKRKINQQGLNNYMQLINAANWSSQQELPQQL